MNRVDSDTTLGPLFGAIEPPSAAPMVRGVDPSSEPISQPISEGEVFALVVHQVRRLARHHHDIDELTQLAAEQALRSLPKFEGRSRLSTWTFRICYLTIRKHDRWYRRWLKRFTLSADGELPDAPSDAVDVDERCARNEQRARLLAAVDRLSAKRREVVLMHDLEGLTVDEIAQIVGAAPVAVRSRLRDGRKALAELLAQDPYFGDEACRTGATK